MRRTSPPLWFSICAAVALAVLCRYSLAGSADATLADGRAPVPSQAFLGLVIFVIGVIWKGLEAAARVTLAAVAYSVKLLWLFASKTGNALIDLGHGVLTGLRAAWRFFELSYEKVIKPAFTKFWRWFDKFRKWLDDTFGPTLAWLRRLRDSLLRFWATWVRPWLDFIDVTRRVLRVLSSLGLKWARELDKRLGELEEKIERPFRLLIAKVNEVINLVNRVITLDGLLTRLALIRSLERDYIYAWRAAVNPWHMLIEERHRKQAAAALAAQLIAAGVPVEVAIAVMLAPLVQQQPRDVRTAVVAYMRDKAGPRAPLLNEMRLIWRRQLLGR